MTAVRASSTLTTCFRGSSVTSAIPRMISPFVLGRVVFGNVFALGADFFFFAGINSPFPFQADPGSSGSSGRSGELTALPPQARSSYIGPGGGPMAQRLRLGVALAAAAVIGILPPDADGATAKPVLHGRHWVAITGKPLGATAGAMMFQKGGNAV